MKDEFENVFALTKMLEQNLERLKNKIELNPALFDWADEDRAEFRRLRIQLTKQMKRLDDELYRK